MPASLLRANFIGPNLKGATLSNVIWSSTTCPDIAKSNQGHVSHPIRAKSHTHTRSYGVTRILNWYPAGVRKLLWKKGAVHAQESVQ